MIPDECRDVFEMLSEYLDGELPVDTCEQLERHIADCPPCVEVVESLRKSVGVYRNFEPAMNLRPLAPEARDRLIKAYREMLARKAARASTGSAQ